MSTYEYLSGSYFATVYRFATPVYRNFADALWLRPQARLSRTSPQALYAALHILPHYVLLK